MAEMHDVSTYSMAEMHALPRLEASAYEPVRLLKKWR
jgi:hypothetical protein